MESIIQNINNCFALDSLSLPPRIKHIECMADKSSRYVMSILTYEMYDTNGNHTNVSCILPDRYFDYKKFSQLFPDCDIDCEDSYHFIVYRK